MVNNEMKERNSNTEVRKKVGKEQEDELHKTKMAVNLQSKNK